MKKTKETIMLKSGQRHKIFSRRFSSVPIEYLFDAKAIGTEELKGEIEVAIQQTLLKKPIQKFPLAAKNTVKATMWDTFVDIYVSAGCDLEVSIPKRNIGSLRLSFWLIALIIIIAGAMVISLPKP